MLADEDERGVGEAGCVLRVERRAVKAGIARVWACRGSTGTKRLNCYWFACVLCVEWGGRKE